MKYILGLDFVELLLKNRFDLVKSVHGQVQRFYLKYRMHGQTYQTKFVGADANNSLDNLNILLQKIKLQRFAINKSSFVELDMTDQYAIE